MNIFWAIGTSLSVMISNNLISMFALDRKYIMYAVTAEKLKAVGWKYFELSDMFVIKLILKIGYFSGMKLKKLKNYKLLLNLPMIVMKKSRTNPTIENVDNNSDNDDSDSDTPRTRFT